MMRGWALYLGNLWDLNSSMEDIPGQLSSVGVPAEEEGGGGVSVGGGETFNPPC